MNTNLGLYLRSVRERTRPEAVGLTAKGARRVPGLRREEVAALAGVSPTYYTRLEQSQAVNASSSVLRSIAHALALSSDDEAYLLKIGKPLEHPSIPEPERLSPYTTMLVDSLSNAAVAVVNYRSDILAWNSLYHRLFASHLDRDAPGSVRSRPNVVRLNFLDEQVRQLYVDREALRVRVS